MGGSLAGPGDADYVPLMSAVDNTSATCSELLWMPVMKVVGEKDKFININTGEDVPKSER